MIYRTYYLSPLGRILLAADDIGLIGVWFEGQKYFGEFPGHMNYVFEEKENHILKDALRWLDIYFSGQKPDFLPKLHLIGTDFQREVWDILLEIPYGQTVTYGEIARKIADEGITVIIANGKRDNILVDLLQHPKETLCTRFIPSNEPVSSVKKWIAHSEGFAKGEIHINECATEVLNSEKAVSILPIGITHVEGEFEKDDIVRIMDFQGNQVGVGKVNCDSKQVQEAIGKHGKKPVVHYDYLYIE